MSYEIISEAKKQAYKFLLRKGRKTMAVYYLTWGLYSLSIGAFYSVLSPLLPPFYVLLLYLAFMSIPNYFTAKMFYLTIKSYLLLDVNSITAVKHFKKKYALSYALRTLAVYVLILLSTFYEPVMLYGLISSIPLFLYVEKSLYDYLFSNEFKITEGKYYDKIAVYSLNLLPAMLILIYLYYLYGDPSFFFIGVALGYIFGVLWLIIFALSMSDLAEGGEVGRREKD